MKKILFVTYDFPFPTTSGGKSRAYHMMKFGGKELELHLFSFVRSDFKEEYKSELEKIGIKKITTVFRKKLMRPGNIKTLFSKSHSIFYYLYFDKKIKEQLVNYVKTNKIDIVHFESFYTGFYISDTLSKLGVRQIFGTENIEYSIYKDYVAQKAPIFIKPLFAKEALKIQSEEERMIRLSDMTLAVTNNDLDVIKRINESCEIVENGVDINQFIYGVPEKIDRTKLLFVGNFSYFPNVDAIQFFYKEIFVNLPEKFTLTIIGKKVNTLGIKDSRVSLIEFVPDIGTAYSTADIFISPIRIGGGTNFKILEAMAMGLPVIAHSARVKDLGAVSGRELLTAEKAPAFIEQIELLSKDYVLSLSISKSAREFIEKRYAWDIIGKKLNTLWKNL